MLIAIDFISESDIINIAKGNEREVSTTDTVKIGRRLRELRGKRTIKEVSDATGIGWSTLCMYELGKRRPSDGVKVILAEYYGVTIQQLFYDDDIA